MTIAKLKHLQGSPTDLLETFFKVVHDGDYGIAKKHSFTFAAPSGDSVVFKGDFKVVNGVVKKGTVTGFDIYDGATKVLSATDYAFSFKKLDKAIEEYQDTNIRNDLNSLLIEKTVQIGSGEDDLITGAIIRGSLLGRGGSDTLAGLDGHETIKGGAGDDELWIGYGRDSLSGGSGDDTFFFHSHFNGVDKIMDFSAEDDMINFGSYIYDALTPGAMSDSVFRIGGKAQTADQHVIYNKNTGEMFYDEDGVGGAAQVKLAVLSKGLDLTAANFHIEI